MSSLLDKAIAARLREDHEEADRLFHEFVLERARTVNESITTTGEVDVDAVVEGKSYKRGKDEDDQDVQDKKKKDQERKDGSKQKRSDVSEDAVEEGKTYKRGKDDEDIGDKKRKDQDRKDGAKQKRQMDEAIELDDEDQVDEGQLTATQGDDGTLVIVHDPAGAAMDDLASPMPVVDALPDAGDEFAADDSLDMDLGGDVMAPDMEVSDEPLPGIDDLNDEAFESLKESLAEELKTILVDANDGVYADGSKVSQETHSPVPNVDAEDRMDGAEPVEVKGQEHNGFDKEPAPKVDNHGSKATNSKGKAADGQKTV